MEKITYLIFAIIPAVLWILYFNKKDKGEKEPARLLILAACLGALAVIPAAFLELFFTRNIIPFFFSDLKDVSTSIISNSPALFINLFVVSVIEEILKFLSIRLTIYNSRYFNEISDGIIYIVAAALGFAAFENFLYFLNFGNDIIFARSLFTPLFHASASAIVGHYLGLAKWDKKYRKKVHLALIYSIILHFVYNSLVFFSQFTGGMLLISLAIVLLAFSGKWMLDTYRQTEEMDDRCSLRD